MLSFQQNVCVIFKSCQNDIRDVEIANVVDWIQHECLIVHNIVVIIFALKIVARFQWST